MHASTATFLNLLFSTSIVVAAESSSYGSKSNDHQRHFSVDQKKVKANASPNPPFNYGSDKVRGVNLGGWLVAEPWITPSLFDNTNDDRVIDEWTLGKYVSDAGDRLEKHWKTWITEDDFRQIAAANLNHVRLPIPYWGFDVSQNENYYKGSQADYLWKACDWARKYGLKVLIDLHGAPGSQNGFDNSGKKGPIHFGSNSTNALRAKNIIGSIAAKAQSDYSDVVGMIEFLNEPLTTGGLDLGYVQQYYRDAYGHARSDSGSTAALMIHDGFQSLSKWNGFMPPPDYQQVLLDTHIYTVFNEDQIQLSKQDRMNQLCDHGNDLVSSNSNLWTVVGEWTTASTDCAKYLNGRGVGARYDATYPGVDNAKGSCDARTGDGSNFTDFYKSYLAQMFHTQAKTYERASGWIYWTWKTEMAADWDYQRGLAGGWIPKTLGNYNQAQC